MAAGLTATMTVASVNQQAGIVLANLDAALEQVVELKVFLDWYGSSNLQTLGFTAGDAAVLISAVTDAKKLADIYAGAETQSPAYDFRTFTKQLIATGVH